MTWLKDFAGWHFLCMLMGWCVWAMDPATPDNAVAAYVASTWVGWGGIAASRSYDVIVRGR